MPDALSRGELPALGTVCSNFRGGTHVLVAPADDAELQTVLQALRVKDLPRLFGGAIEASIDYVLDGARTGRFDLTSSAVDSDERRTVGTKLQYHLLDALGLPKLRSPDTIVAEVPVDIKGTVGSNWSIPREGQCELCILVQIDADRSRHQSWLMRTHRLWLHGGAGNGDQKRGVIVAARDRYGVPLYKSSALEANPLRLLDAAGVAAVFAPGIGLRVRLTELFSRLPGVVFPRRAIVTVGFELDDPLRRARQAKPALAEAGYELLVGKWPAERAKAASLGIDLPEHGWVAVPLRPGDTSDSYVVDPPRW